MLVGMAEGCEPQACARVTGLITVHLDPVDLTLRGGCKFRIVHGSHESASRAFVPNRSPDAIGGFEEGLTRPRLRPELVGLLCAQPVVADT